MLENLIDKGITVLIAYVIVRRIPKRFLSQYALDGSEDQADLDDLDDLDEDEDEDEREATGASSRESSARPGKIDGAMESERDPSAGDPADLDCERTQRSER